MKNTKLRRILLLLACAVLLVSLSVGATLAYLTSTKTVTNTFTVGKVEIKLDEATVDTETGKAKPDGTRTEDGNKEIRLVPGRTIDKDPTVTVLDGSEDCYVRVKVIVTVPGWEDAEDDTGTEVAPAGEDFETWAHSFEDAYIWYDDRDSSDSHPGFNRTNWEVSEPEIATGDHTVTYILTYKNNNNNIVAENGEGTVLEPIFTHVCVPDTLGNAELAKLAGMTINAVAEAIQAEGFGGDSSAAWQAFADRSN